MGSQDVLVSFRINGRPVKVRVPPNTLLVDLIRDKLGLTGTKKGCGVGECGACTVLVDGQPMNSCLMLAVAAEGRDITTIEGISGPDGLHPIQEALVDEGAVQCGFCTPGMVMSLKALFDRNPAPTRAEIVEAISGNLCRCTGYAKIISAAERLARQGSGRD
jgi:carbon-monoxide dehydrogenase small subunit